MAKVLKTAALVIGAVALVVATAGALAPVFTAAALASVGVTASFTAIATVLALTAAALSFGAALLTPKPRMLGGDPTKWKADPFAGLPYMVGRTLNSGNIVRRITHGTNNKYETFVTVLSCAGPIQSIDTFFANRTTQAFDGSGNATGGYRDQIFQRMQLGNSPEPAALLSPIGGVPGMDSSSKLSGLAASVMTFAYDSKATIPFTAEVTPAWIGHGVKCYDPRQDSTYPGGVGPCRALDESTYVWSENPFVHAITWCLGRWQNGKRVIGLGAPIGTIDLPAMVAGANLADANNWKVGGVVYSRPDAPWTVLKAFLQAAAAIPIMVGGSISCMAETPRVSLATITDGDIVGEVSLTATQSRRGRINGVIPRYRSEAHDWQVVAGDLVQVADYVTLDGGERTKDIDYVLVQDVGQATVLGRYEIENAREFGPVTVQLKPAWMNYRVGDCVTLAPREIAPQKMLILSREVDPATGIVTFTMRSETDGKHPFALGQTGVAPATATLNPYVLPQTAPAAGAWTLTGGTITNNGEKAPALIINGACEVPNADGIIFEYRVAGSSGWIGGALAAPLVTNHVISSVTALTSYEAAVSYRSSGMIGDRLILGPITTGAIGADWTNITDSAGTKPADNATVGGTIGVDIKLTDTPLPVPPGLLLNSALKLTPAGQLQYEPIFGEVVPIGDLSLSSMGLKLTPAGQLQYSSALGDIIPIGSLKLEDFGAASAASNQQLGRDLDRIARAVQTALNEASRTRAVFTNAGFVVDPITGVVTISAIQQTADTISEVSLKLSAAEAAITARASITYVDNKIALAMLDPSQVPIYGGLELRISTAEFTINALTSAVSSKASNITVDALGARVTTAESDIDALDGQIRTKVESSDFDRLGARVAGAEQTLSAIGDSAAISSAISVSRSLARDADAAAKSALGALLNGDLTRQTTIAAIATARQELTAKINDDGSAAASERLALALRVASAEAQAISETAARIDAIGVLVSQITQLTATLGDTGAAVTSEAAARAAADGTLTAGLSDNVALSRTLGSSTAAAGASALSALLTGDATKRTGGDALAAARDELTAKINGDVDVVVQRVTALLARMGLSDASLVAEQAVRAAGDSALAQSILTLTATVGDNTAGIRSANIARIDGDQALADEIDTMSARVGAAEAASLHETQVRADGDTALAGEIDQLTGRVGDAEATATRDRQARVDGDGALARDLGTLNARVGGAESTAITDRQARSDGDTALAGAIDQLASRVGTAEASVDSERITRAAADGTLIAGLADSVALSQALGGNTAAAGASALTALLTGDTTKRTSGAALAAARDELTAKINGDVDVVVQRVTALLARMGLSEASLVAEQAVRAAGDSALAQSILTLTATVGDNTAAISSANVARVDGDQALADRIDTTNARVGAAEAATVHEVQARADGDTALAGEIDQLTGRVGDAEATATRDRQARVDGDGALADALDTLNARVGGAEASAVTDRQARVDGDGALASEIDQLSARLGSSEASVRAETQARADADGALSARVDTLSAQAGANTSNLTNETQARADADSALAARVNTLKTTQDGHSATITEQAASINGLKAHYSLDLDVDGHVVGYVANNDGSRGELTFRFDRTQILRPDGTLLFRAGSASAGEDPSVVYMPNVVVDRLKINTAVVPAFVSMNTTIDGPGWSDAAGDGGGSGGAAGPNKDLG